jgi:cAMP-dependent protein kinase regulator
MDVLPQQLEKKAGKGPRSSVSAEAYGTWNKKADFNARVVEKSEEVKNKILIRLQQSFLFSSLTEIEIEIVIGALEERKHIKGDKVI